MSICTTTPYYCCSTIYAFAFVFCFSLTHNTTQHTLSLLLSIQRPPPFTSRIWPVTHSLAPDAKKSTASAISEA